jgi:putative redox protein
MTHEIDSQWMGKMQFNALVNGHTIVMDGPEKIGGEDNGPIPKPLILTALSGCTGMDIISLLRKWGKEVKDFSVRVTGEISATQPIEYTSVHLVYSFAGPLENREAALRAVTDSQEKYCGVSHMLKKILPVSWDVYYNNEKIVRHKEAREKSEFLGEFPYTG